MSPVPGWPDTSYELPDGRQLVASYEGEPVGWLVGLRDGGRSAAARDIRDALFDLLGPIDGMWPGWFKAAVDVLSGRVTAIGRRYPCACCAHLTLTEAPPWSNQLCAVCFWEDDLVQFHDVDSRGGANTTSLAQARQNFLDHHVSELRFASCVRCPVPAEIP